jgi:hypothetical protein
MSMETLGLLAASGVGACAGIMILLVLHTLRPHIRLRRLSRNHYLRRR